MDIQRKSYPLEGDSMVEVFKVFEPLENKVEYYFAIVEMDGVYPKPGSIAKNQGRDEYFLVLEGEFEVTVNGTVHKLKQNEACIAIDGDEYITKGKGKMLVFVRDQKGGQSTILKK